MISYLLFTGLAAGISPPIGFVYSWLWNNFTYFRILTDPSKFMYISILCFSALLGVSVAEIYGYLKRLKITMQVTKINGGNFSLSIITPNLFPKIFIGFTAFLILFNSYPLMSGNLSGSLETVNVPNYYHQFRRWVIQQGSDFRVVIVPLSPPGISPTYTWGYSISGGVYHAVITPPVPMLGPTPSKPADYIYSLITNNATDRLGKISALWNVKYIVIANDMVDARTGKKIPINEIKATLDRQSDIRLLTSFGELYVYENLEYHQGWIHGTSNYMILPNNREYDTYVFLCEKYDSFKPQEVVLLSSGQLPDVKEILNQAINVTEYTPVNKSNMSKDLHLPKNSVSATYEKISTTKYIVHINSSKPFVLVFSQSFDPMWKASIVGENTVLKHHFIVNIYANGWYVNRTGTYDIIIEYEPQKIFEVGSFVSIAFFFILLTLIVSESWFKKRRLRVLRE
jgi:hypothetical protein